MRAFFLVLVYFCGVIGAVAGFYTLFSLIHLQDKLVQAVHEVELDASVVGVKERSLLVEFTAPDGVHYSRSTRADPPVLAQFAAATPERPMRGWVQWFNRSGDWRFTAAPRQKPEDLVSQLLPLLGVTLAGVAGFVGFQRLARRMGYDVRVSIKIGGKSENRWRR
ncbi:MAG: hypothetical protein IT462_16110 [Planctomycetes bacterium]|nr:hypothetical protein [Planctomycetota bacterium]